MAQLRRSLKLRIEIDATRCSSCVRTRWASRRDCSLHFRSVLPLEIRTMGRGAEASWSTSSVAAQREAERRVIQVVP